VEARSGVSLRQSAQSCAQLRKLRCLQPVRVQPLGRELLYLGLKVLNAGTCLLQFDSGGTAGSSRPINMPIMAIATSSSTSENPRLRRMADSPILDGSFVAPFQN
jgi:hypothetical protein